MESKAYDECINALSRISKAISSDLYLEDILRLVVTVAAEVMEANICSIMLIDEKTKQLATRASQSVNGEYDHKPPLKIGEGIAGNVAATNQVRAIRDVLNEREYKYKAIAKKAGLRSLLCIPLAIKGRVIGVLNCYSPKPRDYTGTEVSMLTSIAAQAAVAIENADLMVKSRVVLEELEARKKIERAKGLLMKKENLSEEEAYLKLKKFSMDRRKSMREVAEAIILVDSIKK
ncbi:MAG: GAF domain-containing protein [Elusimicrobia bacterium]|nr:GAF domain-containing protein [Candidatus Obscuribacterium magneticum]